MCLPDTTQVSIIGDCLMELAMFATEGPEVCLPLLGSICIIVEEFLPTTLKLFVLRSCFLAAGIAWDLETTAHVSEETIEPRLEIFILFDVESAGLEFGTQVMERSSASDSLK